MASQRDTANRIGSVKNIQKITSAMQMVAAARLRRAEQRIQALRPYADVLTKMTRQAAEAAGNVPQLPILQEREEEKNVGLVLIAGDRGLSGSFNSQIIRAGLRRYEELREEEGKQVTLYAVGRRIDGSLNFRNLTVKSAHTGFTDRPAFADARNIAEELMADYIDEKIDSVEIVYNSYVSPLSQVVTSQRVLPLQQAEILEGGLGEPVANDKPADDAEETSGMPPLWIYEPEPEELLKRLIPDFVEITMFRALLESAASEMGAKMTAMQSASDNASDMIKNLTLEMNRQRQAAITQEILEVVGGAEGV